MSQTDQVNTNVIVKLVSVVTDGLARSKIIITREDFDTPEFYKANERKKCEFHKIATSRHYRELINQVIGPTTGTISAGSATDFIDNKYTGSRPSIPYYKDFINCATALFLTNKRLSDYKIMYTKNSASSYICHVEVVGANSIIEDDFGIITCELHALYRMMTGECVTDNLLVDKLTESMGIIDNLRNELELSKNNSTEVQKYKEGYEVFTLIKQIISKTADK